MRHPIACHGCHLALPGRHACETLLAESDWTRQGGCTVCGPVYCDRCALVVAQERDASKAAQAHTCTLEQWAQARHEDIDDAWDDGERNAAIEACGALRPFPSHPYYAGAECGLEYRGSLTPGEWDCIPF